MTRRRLSVVVVCGRRFLDAVNSEYPLLNCAHVRARRPYGSIIAMAGRSILYIYIYIYMRTRQGAGRGLKRVTAL